MASNKVTLHKDSRPGRASKWLVRWYGQYDPETEKQKRYSKSFKTKIQAERFQLQKQFELNDGDPRDPINITISELCKEFMANRKHSLRTSTLSGYTYTIRQLKEYFSPNSIITTITKQQAQKFINTREITNGSHIKTGKQLSGWGREFYHKTAHTIFNCAIDWGYIRKNPFSGMKHIKVSSSELSHFFKSLMPLKLGH